jgi:hypothetical protein
MKNSIETRIVGAARYPRDDTTMGRSLWMNLVATLSTRGAPIEYVLGERGLLEEPRDN